jgi:hypothetical protein
MLQSRCFAARPRSATLLRYFVEESLRNDHAPIGQRLIAVHGLGFDAGFSPARSAEVRVKVARLRKAIERYYAGPGRGDPVVLSISPGPYRLVVTRNEGRRITMWRSPRGGRAARGPCSCWWNPGSVVGGKAMRLWPLTSACGCAASWRRATW